MWDIMGNICKRAQGNLWGLYMEHLWEPNNMENIWVICGEYLCGLKIVYGLVWYFLVSGLMKLGRKNLYLNNESSITKININTNLLFVEITLTTTIICKIFVKNFLVVLAFF